MKIFSTEIRRRQAVKLMLGVGILAYLFRVVMGLTNEYGVAGGVSVSGLRELFFVMLALSSVFLLWDIRDSRAR